MPRSERVNRAAVVETAAALADARGSLEQVTLADVAAELNIRVPSLYNHVNGLDGLRREVALLGVRELTAQVQAAAVGRAGDDAVIAIAHAYRQYARQHPGRYGMTLAAPNPDDAELVEAAEQLLVWLYRVLEAYHLNDTDAVHVVRSLRSVMHGFSTLEAAGGFQMAVDLDETYDYLIRMFLAGLHVPPAFS